MTDAQRTRAFGLAACAVAAVTALLVLVRVGGSEGEDDRASSSGGGRPTIVPATSGEHRTESSTAAAAAGARRRAARRWAERELPATRVIAVEAVDGDPPRAAVTVAARAERTTYVLTLEPRGERWQVTAVR
jgi:hypothetical protein